MKSAVLVVLFATIACLGAEAPALPRRSDSQKLALRNAQIEFIQTKAQFDQVQAQLQAASAQFQAEIDKYYNLEPKVDKNKNDLDKNLDFVAKGGK